MYFIEMYKWYVNVQKDAFIKMYIQQHETRSFLLATRSRRACTSWFSKDINLFQDTCDVKYPTCNDRFSSEILLFVLDWRCGSIWLQVINLTVNIESCHFEGLLITWTLLALNLSITPMLSSLIAILTKLAFQQANDEWVSW